MAGGASTSAAAGVVLEVQTSEFSLKFKTAMVVFT